MSTGKLVPDAWFNDERELRPIVKESEQDLKQIKEDFERRAIYHTKGS